MKKILLFILLALYTNISFAQTDMITALQAIGEDVVYTEYLFVTINPGKKNEITEKRYKANLKLEKNRFGKIVGFNALGMSEGKLEGIKYNHMNNKFDNYTHPSYMESGDRWAYAIINGVIFYLDHFENTTSFDISQVWLPKIPKEKANEAIFQGGKMSDLESADLKKLVKDYFAAMKKIQEASPYSESEQKEADAMKFTVDSTNIMGRQSNADYWNSEAGQKKLNEMRNKKDGDGWITIKNTGKKELSVMTDKGTASFISAGSSAKWPCYSDIYYCSKDSHNTWNVKGALIVKGKEYCGKIFEVKND